MTLWALCTEDVVTDAHRTLLAVQQMLLLLLSHDRAKLRLVPVSYSQGYLHQWETWSTSGYHCPEQKIAAVETSTDVMCWIRNRIFVISFLYIYWESHNLLKDTDAFLWCCDISVHWKQPLFQQVCNVLWQKTEETSTKLEEEAPPGAENETGTSFKKVTSQDREVRAVQMWLRFSSSSFFFFC